MDKHAMIEIALRPTSTTDADDTTGLIARNGGCFPQPGSQVFQIPTIPVPVRFPVPLPGPLPLAERSQEQDVQGYMWWTIPAGLLMGYGLGSLYNDEVGRDQTYYKSNDKP